ncbi:hypothetical protein ACOMHN_011584 [Nucella lapillus]
MASVLKDLIRQYDEAKPHADPRTRDWLLVENSPWPVWILTIVYIVFVIIGPRLMKNRPPLDLKWFLVVYNLSLVALSLYMFLEMILSVLNAGYNLTCAPYSKESWPKPEEQRVANVMWWYFFSKAIELLDTVLMIVRKKNEQVTFLHVFHHATMLNIWWWTMMFIPGGMSWFGACMNCLVHVVMYTYYGLSAIPSLKGQLWWKRYITRFQLLQFCVTFTHTVNSIREGCDFPRWGQNLLSGYMVVMLILFGNFYVHAYIKRRSNKLKNSAKKKGVATAAASSPVTNGNVHTSAEGGDIRTKVE